MISVIIPTYKRSKFIKRAVVSVFSQTYQNIEVIVVDDNGLGTEEQLHTSENVKELISKGLNIRYIPHEINRGGCAARNTGIKVAQGEFVALLDDDDEWLPTFLEKLLPKMHNPAVGAVYSMHYVKIDDRIYDIPGVQINKRGWVYKDLLTGWGVVSTSLFLLRKKYVDSVGGFDETLQSFQDYDMWVRMSRICEFDFVAEHLAIKENGHSDDQVAVNPVRRKAGLDALDIKMKKELSMDEYDIFKKFLEKWEASILYTRIMIGKKKKEKLDYCSLYKSYQSIEKSTAKKILAICMIVLGYKTANKMRFIVVQLTGKMRRIRNL